jgi:hypothetical protein
MKTRIGILAVLLATTLSARAEPRVEQSGIWRRR